MDVKDVRTKLGRDVKEARTNLGRDVKEERTFYMDVYNRKQYDVFLYMLFGTHVYKNQEKLLYIHIFKKHEE